MHAALTISGAVRQTSHPPVGMWLLAVLVVALALLNPLACVVHCLPRQVSASTAGLGFAAVCHIPSPGASQQPGSTPELARGQTQTPRAAFAFVAPLPLVLLVATRRTATASFGWTATPQLFVRPLSPPPR